MNQNNIISRSISFLKRQHHDWKVTVIRTSVDKFAYQMVFPYLSVYIVMLGATATQLGMANSIGMIAAGLIGPLTGWLIDRIGTKKIYLFGISLLVISYLIYGITQNWILTILAMAAYWIGNSVSIHSCATICGTCLANEDRATGMTICETVAAGVLGMAGPVVGAFLVTTFGGVNPEGIRPLFFLAAMVSVGTFCFVLTQLSNQGLRKTDGAMHLIRDMSEVVKGGSHLKKWLIISSMSHLPLGMVFAFSQVFAHDIKGADQFILGAMVTCCALTSIVFSVPLGRLADRIGRKRVLFITIPLFSISNIALILAPSPPLLMLAGILQGFYFIGSPIAGAIERELVPADQMARWIGINRLFRMPFAALMAFASGIIWDSIGPQYVFLTFMAIDLLVRLPLLISMPETLKLRFGDRL